MRRQLTAFLSASLVAAAAPDASALGERTLQKRLASAMAGASKASGARVVNLTTGETIYRVRDRAGRLPASNEKLWTAVAALETFGEAGFLRTVALAKRPVLANGTLRGNLYLRGGGDPTLSAARLEVLAQELADAGLEKVTGRVIGDESAFDRRRGPASAGVDFDVDAPLGALVVDRSSGATGEPAEYAAEVLARQLDDAGVDVSLNGRVGRAPRGAVELGARRSPSMRTVIRAMNVDSDNYIAEMLLKTLAVADGALGTTARGAALATDLVAVAYGVTPRIVDGSGLSRRNRSSPRDLVGLLSQLVESEPFYSSLAVMGRSGTLDDRLESDYARGRCRGKTGTLVDVSALSGYCETAGGDLLAYSIIMNRTSVDGARSIQDRMVSSIARYE